MMQAANVKQVSKTQLANQAYHQTATKKSQKQDVKLEVVAEPTKAPSFNRFLEAYGDCV
jgi:hypothetical protein